MHICKIRLRICFYPLYSYGPDSCSPAIRRSVWPDPSLLFLLPVHRTYNDKGPAESGKDFSRIAWSHLPAVAGCCLCNKRHGIAAVIKMHQRRAYRVFRWFDRGDREYMFGIRVSCLFQHAADSVSCGTERIAAGKEKGLFRADFFQKRRQFSDSPFFYDHFCHAGRVNFPAGGDPTHWDHSVMWNVPEKSATRAGTLIILSVPREAEEQWQGWRLEPDFSCRRPECAA